MIQKVMNSQTEQQQGSDGILKNKQQASFTTNSDKAVLFTSVLFKQIC